MPRTSSEDQFLSPRQRRVPMNNENVLKKLDKLLEVLTTSGRRELDDSQLNSLKKVLKRGDRYVDHAFGELWTALNREHSEIRLSAFQVCDQLFHRSHRFRDHVLNQFEDFVQLVTAVNVGTSLPPPKASAKLLYQTAIKAIHQWNAKYRTTYKKLALGYGYLKTVKKVDFSAAEPRAPLEQQDSEERQKRLDEHRKHRLDRLVREMEETIPEMDRCITEIRSCFELLLPNQDFAPDWSEILSSKTGETTGRGKGVGKSSLLEKTRSEVEKCEDDVRKCEDDVEKCGNDTVKKCRNDVEKCDNDVEKSEGDVEAKGKEDVIEEKMVESEEEELPKSEEDTKVQTETANESQITETKAKVTDSAKLEQISDGTPEPEITKTPEPAEVEMTKSEVTNTFTSKPVITVKPEVTEMEEEIRDEDPGPSTSGLAPNPDHDSEAMSDDSEDSDFEEVPEADSALLRSHGLVDRNFSLEIELVPQSILESEDNREIIKTLSDGDKLVASQHMPRVISWLEDLAKSGAPVSVIKRAIDMREALADVRRKYEQLASRIRFCESPGPSEIAPSTADESIHAKLQTKSGNGGNIGNHGNVVKVSGNGSHGNQAGLDTGAGDRKSKLLKVAPYRAYDRDLKFWGKEDELRPATIKRGTCLHRFLTATDEDEFTPPGASTGTERTMTYIGESRMSERFCRAPLPNGKLCPRQDRVKCPFHGRIIDRDACGKPIHARDKPRFNWGEIGEKQNWQDAELMADIEAAKGVDLGSAKAKAKPHERKRKYPGLTDLNKAKNTVTKRIEKKIFNKGAVRRVNAAMNKVDARKCDNKFGSSFIHTFK